MAGETLGNYEQEDYQKNSGTWSLEEATVSQTESVNMAGVLHTPQEPSRYLDESYDSDPSPTSQKEKLVRNAAEWELEEEPGASEILDQPPNEVGKRPVYGRTVVETREDSYDITG